MDDDFLLKSFASEKRLEVDPTLTTQVKKWWKVDTACGEQPELTEANAEPYPMYDRTLQARRVFHFKGTFTDAVQ